EKAFISLFNETARYHRRAKVFEDFVSCSVIALENRLCFNQKREDKYLQIIKGYEKADVSRIAQLLALVGMSMMSRFSDFLGT
ncbi:hypothetical protein, partial [Klebsiella quasipneumoniae]